MASGDRRRLERIVDACFGNFDFDVTEEMPPPPLIPPANPPRPVDPWTRYVHTEVTIPNINAPNAAAHNQAVPEEAAPIIEDDGKSLDADEEARYNADFQQALAASLIEHEARESSRGTPSSDAYPLSNSTPSEEYSSDDVYREISTSDVKALSAKKTLPLSSTQSSIQSSATPSISSTYSSEDVYRELSTSPAKEMFYEESVKLSSSSTKGTNKSIRSSSPAPSALTLAQTVYSAEDTYRELPTELKSLSLEKEDEAVEDNLQKGTRLLLEQDWYGAETLLFQAREENPEKVDEINVLLVQARIGVLGECYSDSFTSTYIKRIAGLATSINQAMDDAAEKAKSIQTNEGASASNVPSKLASRGASPAARRSPARAPSPDEVDDYARYAEPLDKAREKRIQKREERNSNGRGGREPFRGQDRRQSGDQSKTQTRNHGSGSQPSSRNNSGGRQSPVGPDNRDERRQSCKSGGNQPKIEDWSERSEGNSEYRNRPNAAVNDVRGRSGFDRDHRARHSGGGDGRPNRSGENLNNFTRNDNGRRSFRGQQDWEQFSGGDRRNGSAQQSQFNKHDRTKSGDYGDYTSNSQNSFPRRGSLSNSGSRHNSSNNLASEAPSSRYGSNGNLNSGSGRRNSREEPRPRSRTKSFSRDDESSGRRSSSGNRDRMALSERDRILPANIYKFTRIWVGGLHPEFFDLYNKENPAYDEVDDLKEAFDKFGSVKSITVNPATAGRPVTAFVVYKDTESPRRAIQDMQGRHVANLSFGSMKLNLRFAYERNPRDSTKVAFERLQKYMQSPKIRTRECLGWRTTGCKDDFCDREHNRICAGIDYQPLLHNN